MIENKKSASQKKSGPAKGSKYRSTKDQIEDNKPRALKHRLQRQEEIRDKFKGIEYARQLESCYDEYVSLTDELSIASVSRAKFQSNLKKPLAKTKAAAIKQEVLRQKLRDDIFLINSQIDLLRIRIDVIKGKIDLNIRRLRFCLPELKAIELSDPEGNSPISGFMDILRGALQKDA